MSDNLIQAITVEENIETAYRWLCERRKAYSANSDIWDFRFHWQKEHQSIIDDLRSGCYQFSEVSLYPINGEVRSLWSARDALVLRAIAQVLGKYLDIHPTCLHTRDRGGVHAGLAWAYQQRSHYRYFYRSDVKGYYRHIRHGVLLRQLKQQIKNRKLLAILRRYLARVEVCGGVYCPKHQGLNKGDPLAPLMGAIYLKKLDHALSKLGEYRRFMDDWLLFTEHKTELNRAITNTKRILKKLGMIVHTDKTFTGKTDQRFHFLGLEFEAEKIRLPRQRLLAIKTKIAALRKSSDGAAKAYVNRFFCWLQSVLKMFWYARPFCTNEDSHSL